MGQGLTSNPPHKEASVSMESAKYLSPADFSGLSDLLDRWHAIYPGMGVLALLAEADQERVPLLQRTCRQRQIPLVGAIFPALVEGPEFHERGLFLLRFNRAPIWVLQADIPDTPDGLDAAMDDLVHQLRPHLSNHLPTETTLFLLLDGMLPNIASLLDALYLRLANRVSYMGANAGSKRFQPMPCLFDDQRQVDKGLLALLLTPHHGAILEHGYQAPEGMITATSTQGNRILQIDWQPAFEVYRERVRTRVGMDINQDNFYQYSVHFPFGIVRANGITLVRIPVALEEDGSLFCIGEVPANSVLVLLDAPAVNSRYTQDKILGGLEAVHGPLRGADMLLFYCAGRHLHLGEAARAELHQLCERSAVRSIIGAISLGEIGCAVEREYPLFHNATLVATLWEHGTS